MRRPPRFAATAASPRKTFRIFSRHLPTRACSLPKRGTARPCYRSSESLSEYARGRLQEAQEETEFRNRHATYYHRFATDSHPRYTFADQPAALDRLEVEHGNLRSALAWDIGPGGNAARGMSMAGSLCWFWFVRGHHAEARDWISRFLDATPSDRNLLARSSALHGAAEFAQQRGDLAGARKFFEESLACHRELGDQHNVGGVVTEPRQRGALGARHARSTRVLRAEPDDIP